VRIGVCSREIFNKWEAQRWWGENYDRIVELYNVQTFSGRQQGVSTPTSSVDDSILVGTTPFKDFTGILCYFEIITLFSSA
jgi:hypothetical protein